MTALTHRVVHYNAVPGTLKMIEDAQNKTNVDLHLDAATAPWCRCFFEPSIPHPCIFNTAGTLIAKFLIPATDTGGRQ